MKEKNKTVLSFLMPFLIISIFFDSYSIFYISTFPVTLFVINMALILICSLLQIIRNGKINFDSSHVISLLMIIYLLLNYLLTGAKNASSFLLAEFYFITYFLMNRDESSEDINKYLKIFEIGMNILAIYGIYQFVARIYGLPFSDIILEGHMVMGFNWTNPIIIGGKSFLRSNAIFREPSFFSQYLAINILLLISKILNDRGKKFSNIFWIIINIIGFLVSFSGTGCIILVIGIILYIFRLKKNFKINLKLIFYSIIGIIGIVLILNSGIGNYFAARLSELFVYKKDNVSGYVRFRSGADVLSSAWEKNTFIGIGIGTVYEFIGKMVNNYAGMTVNGFYRPAAELGLIGIVLWLTYIFSIFRKKNLDAMQVLALQCVLFPLIICHEAFLSNYYWIILFILDYKYIVGERLHNE